MQPRRKADLRNFQAFIQRRQFSPWQQGFHRGHVFRCTAAELYFDRDQGFFFSRKDVQLCANPTKIAGDDQPAL
ncbi:MAG: hypothetical protein RIQ81_1860 [Pseudomonadota bacterium]